jgi:hypothetical protein
MVLVNQDGLKFNATHQLMVYANDVNIMGGSIHTVKRNAETVVVAGKEDGLEMLIKVYGHVSRSECRLQSKYKD